MCLQCTITGQIKMLWKELDAIRPQSVDESSSVLVDSVGDIQNMLQQESLPSQGGTSAS